MILCQVAIERERDEQLWNFISEQWEQREIEKEASLSFCVVMMLHDDL